MEISTLSFMTLIDLLKAKRPNLRPKSYSTYVTILTSIYKKAFSKEPWYDPQHIDARKFTTNFDDICRALDTLTSLQTRKTTLSALFVLTEIPKYREMMLEDIIKYDSDISKQERSARQKETWLPLETIVERYEEYAKNVDEMIRDGLYYNLGKETANPPKRSESVVKVRKPVFTRIVRRGVGACFSTTFIPPRRALDYSNMKIKNYDETTDNVYDGHRFIFNQYKTMKSYGTQIIDLPTNLCKILNTIICITHIFFPETEYLFLTPEGKQYSENTVKTALEDVFGVTLNQIRHSYLTAHCAEYSKETKKVQDMLTKMGTSDRQLTTYVKLDV